jgi:hypothetical protein
MECPKGLGAFIHDSRLTIHVLTVRISGLMIFPTFVKIAGLDLPAFYRVPPPVCLALTKDPFLP